MLECSLKYSPSFISEDLKFRFTVVETFLTQVVPLICVAFYEVKSLRVIWKSEESKLG